MLLSWVDPEVVGRRLLPKRLRRSGRRSYWFTTLWAVAMSRSKSLVKMQLGTVAALLAVACGGGGLEYWLYPAPHLEKAQEAIFIAEVQHPVLAIDGEEMAERCWGDLVRHPQAYQQRSMPCHLHIRPGKHTVVFHPGANSLERSQLDFTAEAGKSYGLDWTGCMGSLNQRHQRTCVVNVREVSGR